MSDELRFILNVVSYILLAGVALYTVHSILSDDSSEHLAKHNEVNATIIEKMNACDDECVRYITHDWTDGYQLTPLGKSATTAELFSVISHMDDLNWRINDAFNNRKFKWWELRFRALVKVNDDFHSWATIQRDYRNTREALMMHRPDTLRAVWRIQ
jgi:hypothetical protein